MKRKIRKLIKSLIVFFRLNFSKTYFDGTVKIELNRKILTRDILYRILRGKYEINERRILSKYLKSDDKVLELGTGIGIISLYCSLICQSNNVYTYEANPTLTSFIKRNYALNERYPNLYNFILVNNPNVPYFDFYVCKDFYSSSLTRPSKFESVIKVPTRDFLSELELVKPTFLITDIEGFEYELFKGISLPQSVTKVLIELHPKKAYTQFDIAQHLETMGFLVEKEYLALNQLYASRPKSVE